MVPVRLALIAEDEILVLMDIEEALTQAGVSRFCSFASSSLALEWLETHTPDLAIIAYRLVDGPSEAIACALASRKVPTIVYSGNEYQPDIHTAYEGFRWLRKPTTTPEFVAAIRETLDLQE